MTTKTLIIGAGPIGLVLAALLKHNFRSMEVTMYEKRSHYTRQQIVIFRPNVLRLLPREIQKFLKTRGCFINHPNVNKGNCYTKKTPGELISLPLHLFEEDVEEYCKSLGVKRTIQDISALSPFSQKKLRETGTIEGTKYENSPDDNALSVKGCNLEYEIKSLSFTSSGPLYFWVLFNSSYC